MKKSLVALAIFAAVPMAFAQSQSDSSSQSTSNPVVSSGNQVGNSGADSSSSSTANPNNANQQFIQLNTLTPENQTVNSNVRYSGTQTVKNVPGIAMSGPASGPCTGASGGLGVAGPGFGVGLNGAKVDDGCTVRENTRVAGQVYQALDSADPLKAEARAAMVEGLTIIRNMNAKIGGEYNPPAPAQQKTAAAPAPASATVATVKTGEPTDPYVRARLGLPALK